MNVKPNTSELSEQFLTLYTNITNFVVCFSMDSYINFFQNFLSLGETLGFSVEDIETAYLYKNNINHERQDNGY